MYKLGVLEEMRVEEKEKQMYKKFQGKVDISQKLVWTNHMARSNLKALETLGSGSKKAEINTEEFLLDQNEFGYTAFQFVGQNKKLETLKEL